MLSTPTAAPRWSVTSTAREQMPISISPQNLHGTRGNRITSRTSCVVDDAEAERGGEENVTTLVFTA
jgi:hypothetical protein